MAQKNFKLLLFLIAIVWLPNVADAQNDSSKNHREPEPVIPIVGIPETYTPAADPKIVAEPEVSDIGSAPDQKALDNLTKFLVGSKWNGTFTMRDTGDKLHTEEYEIVSAEREPSGDEWMLVAKIKYMKKDVKVPVGLLIKWVDRTPMIVLDQVTIPGMGTFDSRVIIRKGMYAGTWAHGKVGGHLFGKITSAADAAAAEKAKAKSSEEKK